MELQEWINGNKEIADALVQIQEMDASINEQAEMAFHRISEMCNVPKLPEDVSYLDDIEEVGLSPVSVYEQLGLIKFLDPDVDPRGQVLSAIFYAKEGYRIDLDEVYKKKFGDNTPTEVGIGFVNENTAVEIIFIGPDQSWFDLGCKLFMKSPN